jgi:hypothetical protein
MLRKNTIALTASQIVSGSFIGLVSGWLCFFLVEQLVWKGLIGDRVQSGFWVGLVLLISFGVTYGSAIAGVAEGVIFAGRRFGVSIGRKSTYQGTFLGAPAIVALMLLLNIHWETLVASNLLFYLLLAIAQLLAFIVSLPLRILLAIKCPPELLYIVAAPIGAILGYRLVGTDANIVRSDLTQIPALSRFSAAMRWRKTR